ncbi:hypothetical protein D3C77_467780 [compost metagenome]
MIQIVKPNARIAIIAVYKQEVPVSLAQVMSKEVQIIGASGYNHEDITKVIAHINEKKIPTGTMVTQVYKRTIRLFIPSGTDSSFIFQ